MGEHESFHDLPGDLTALSREFPNMDTLFTTALDKAQEDEDDANDEGNLKGFVVADDYVSSDDDNDDDDDDEDHRPSRVRVNRPSGRLLKRLRRSNV
jgi:hypothetical protein